MEEDVFLTGLNTQEDYIESLNDPRENPDKEHAFGSMFNTQMCNFRTNQTSNIFIRNNYDESSRNIGDNSRVQFNNTSMSPDYWHQTVI